MSETPLEAAEADAAEQHQQTVAEPPDPGPLAPTWDADEGDVAESALEVPLDDDEYR
ncbi:MAG: hypothetical protein QOG34_1184 [Frankiaceae bacterium]|jgi:hypothetical protein|nr:hypothetical protein [Frankiaceae bacterium]